MSVPDSTRLRELLRYDPDTGAFTWRRTLVGRAKAGASAGTRCHTGYWQISIGRRKYSAHRLAWCYVYGSWPLGVIDHINGDPTDNRIANLRDVSQAINQHNQRRSKSPTAGTSFSPRLGKWSARISVNRVRLHLGYFATQAEASAAYQQAKTQHLKEICKHESK